MQNFLTISETTFIGLNDRYPSHLLPKGCFQKFDNALVDDNRIAKRPGTTASTSLGSQNILGCSAFEPSGGTKLQIACLNGSSFAQLYKSTNGTTFTAIGSANITKDAQMNFCQASNSLFGFNGTDAVDFDGTTVTKNRANVPLGKFGIYFHNYLFVAGVSGNPNRLYWSNLGTPTTFTTTDFIDINANDGDMLTGFGILNDELIVFKQYSIWSIAGWSGASFTATTIAGQNTQLKAANVGTPSHQSIVSTGKNLYYLSFSGQTPHIRSLTQTYVSETIDAGVVSFDILNTMDGLNKAQLTKAVGVYDGKYLYWAVPNGSSTTNNLVLVLNPTHTFNTSLGVLHQWATWSGTTPSQYMISTISGRAKVYFGDATTGGYMFLQGTSVYSDNGTAVSMDVRARDYMFDKAEKCKWKYMYVKTKRGSAGTLTVKARIDKAVDFTTQKSISLQGGSPGLGPTGTFTLGVSVLGGIDISKTRVTFAQLTGTLLGVQFSEVTSNSCEIYDYEIYGYKKGLRFEG